MGNVGTGYTRAALADLHVRLIALQRDTPPVVNGAAAQGVVWVQPRLVGTVAVAERTREGFLRHPVWHGLRDIDPRHVPPRTD
ncbi:hypothetical protein [Nocardia abscessus]|uniref:ATP dependent DNA ligase n=1 Tax=Nocardia abscessus TaxID=120957 RepID=UPI001894B510|nr:hypothetical protein [Nocardia abscessus]